MTINKNITENIVLTLGTVVSNVELVLTKTATGQSQTLNPTVISSSLRYLTLELDTTSLAAGEYSMEVIGDSESLKTLKVEVLDYQNKSEYNNTKIYGEYNGSV